MNIKSVLLASALLVVLGASSGCTTTEYVEVRPECHAPAVPYLPDIDRGALWDHLGDERYRELESYIDGLWSYADEQSAMLDALCGKEKAPQ